MTTYDDVAFGPGGQCPDVECGMPDGQHIDGCPESKVAKAVSLHRRMTERKAEILEIGQALSEIVGSMSNEELGEYSSQVQPNDESEAKE